mmetsp:Transcript_31302/g.45813  ORF Transcript_31302/g.45813 Transcript_31302/m.45813 type:complete len:120 (-) Transcript_31302:1415-1774(-)
MIHFLTACFIHMHGFNCCVRIIIIRFYEKCEDGLIIPSPSLPLFTLNSLVLTTSDVSYFATFLYRPLLFLFHSPHSFHNREFDLPPPPKYNPNYHHFLPSTFAWHAWNLMVQSCIYSNV